MKAPIVLVLFSVVFFTGGLRSSCFAQSTTERVTVERKTVGIPTGSIQPTTGFSVSYGVESRLELSPGPVKLIGNVSRIEDGIGISRVLIENVSSAEVVAIKLHWYVFDDEESKSYLKDGETKQIEVDHLGAKSKKEVASGLPGFDEMFKGLAKNGFISGRYYVEVVLSEVLFADGSKWKLQKKSA